MKSICASMLVSLLLLNSFFTFSQTPVYNSYPTASAVIFLDFDGQTVDGTSWNSNGPIVCGPSNMTASQISEIFNRVAEDYRPFNINITTDSTKYWAAPATKRIRVILTVTSSWYGNVGGVSYTGSFVWGDNTPSFVFTALLKYNTKNVAEAASHEAGHTLGLRHQAAYDANCTKTSDYNYGKGSGETGWAPIMGAGYYQNYTLWHNGSNPYGCSNMQDDLSIITSTANGFGYRTDDYDSTFKKAASLSFTNNKFTTAGIISTDTDKDMFKFRMANKGKFKLNATLYGVGASDAGSNLDVQVNLYNSSQTLIGSYNPPEVLAAAIDTTLDQGTYYYNVSGASNQYATEYASLGSYSLDGSYTDLGALPLRLLKLQGSVENKSHKFSWIIDADEQVVKEALEVSDNGRDFQTVENFATDARTYTYLPTENGALQYRLNVLFDNNRQYYSNIIVLKNQSAAKPALVSNVIQNNALTVNSPSAYNYIITDLSGKTISQGKLVQGSNTLYINFSSNGMYVIKYVNGQEQYTQKFVKQ